MSGLDLLAFGPHPDDLEIGLGGTLAKHAALGHSVGLCDLTRGEMSSNGTPDERVREAEAARAVLGAAWRENLALPDRAIGTSQEHTRKVVELIRRVRPRAIAVPYWQDRHPDHQASAVLLREAVFDVLEMADEILSDNEQFVAGLITAAVLAPVSEEFAKSLGVRFLMSPNSTRAQCFLLGAIAGAGFGFLEAMLYGLGGISEDLADWWVIMVVRGGSTSLHVICSGLAGLGWWYWTIARGHRTAVALFTVAILIHAGWNAAFTAIDSRIFLLDTLSNRTIEIIAYSIVAVVSGLMIVAVPLVAVALRERASEADALDGLEPWLAAA
jgi:hypothetical protein